MGSLMNRIAAARKAMFPGTSPDDDPIVVDVPGPDEENEADDTDPVPTPSPEQKASPRPLRMVNGRVQSQSHFERQRRQIDSFDEDYADRWDKIKLQAAKLVALA